MALITCPDCGKEISDRATSCVNCGCPVEAPSQFPEDKIKEIGGVMVNIDELIREHGRDNVAMSKHLKSMTGISLSEAKRIADIAFRNRGIKPLGFLERAQMEAAANESTQNDSKLQKLELKSKKLEIKQQKQEIKDSKNAARCPKCGSTSLSGNKKGFGVGKSVVGGLVGTAVAGPVGLLGLTAGNMGAKKVRVTCLKCGKQFWA